MSFHLPTCFCLCARCLPRVEKLKCNTFPMANAAHQSFRSFLTERFTSLAVDICGEVETLVQSYYEENKRLRSVLHTVLNPEIKLHRIGLSPRSCHLSLIREILWCKCFVSLPENVNTSRSFCVILPLIPVKSSVQQKVGSSIPGPCRSHAERFLTETPKPRQLSNRVG